jgi:hypothetical protein
VHVDRNAHLYRCDDTLVFCRPECALRHAMEYQMWPSVALMHDMALSWRGRTIDRPAPARHELMLYGGPKSLTEFHQYHQQPMAQSTDDVITEGPDRAAKRVRVT